MGVFSKSSCSQNYTKFNNLPEEIGDDFIPIKRGNIVIAQLPRQRTDLTKWILTLALIFLSTLFLCLLGLITFNCPQIQWIDVSVESISEWDLYKIQFQKSYNSVIKEKECEMNFYSNKATVEEHNEKFESGLVTFSLKVNEFSDLDPKEFHSTRKGLIYTPNNTNATKIPEINSNLPSTFDWREQGKVSSVKNQGQCGSCWAFSALGAVESAMLLSGKEAIDLSAEELVDCVAGDCNGGNQLVAWDWLKNNGGVESESSYPYTAGHGAVGQCRKDQGQVVGQIKGYQQLYMPTEEETLKTFLRQNGPLSIDVDARHWSSQYDKGVISCNPVGLDHGVLLIGWGTGSNGDFWIIKNSWGTSWGDGGFAKVAMGSNKDCGITKYFVAYPKIQ